MGLGSALRSVFGRNARASTEAIDFRPLASPYFSGGIGNQPRHDVLLRESLGVADYATRAIANRMATLEPVVKVRRGTEIETLDSDHPLKDLLRNPHPNLTLAQQLRLAGQWLVTVGEAYWLKVGNGFGVPTELHPIPPTKIAPVVRGGVIDHYLVRGGNGQQTPLAEDVVIRAWLPDPEDLWGSEGYLGPNGNVADTLKFAGQHLRSHYQNDATPKSWITSGPDAEGFASKEEKDAFYEDMRQRYHQRDGEYAGLPGILPRDYSIIQLALQSGADTAPLLEYLRDDQLMNYGVPRSVLGQAVAGDRSTAETNAYVFDFHTVSPLARVIIDAWNYQLAVDFDPKLVLMWSPFVARDKAFDLKREDQDLKLKVRTVNEIRQERPGLDPVDYGDEAIGSFTDAPYRPDDAYDLQKDDAAAIGDDRGHRVDVRVEEPPAEAIGVELVFDTTETDREFKSKVDPIRRASLADSAASALAELGGEDFVFTKAAERFLKLEGARLIRRTNATTRRMIQAQLIEANAKGESVDQIAARVRHVFSVRRKHARTIARTEVLKASQTGQLEGYRASGVVVQKQWNTSRDGSVRDSHTIDGQRVDLPDAFTLGDGERADAPGIGQGGTILSAGNAIQCRCFTTPVTDDRGQIEAEWARVVQRERKYVPRMLRAVQAILKRQRDDVLAALEDLS